MKSRLRTSRSIFDTFGVGRLAWGVSRLRLVDLGDSILRFEFHRQVADLGIAKRLLENAYLVDTALEEALF